MGLTPTSTTRKHDIQITQIALLRDPEAALRFLVTRFLQSQWLIVGMAALQIVWLATIAYTGASSNLSKIASLALYSAVAGFAAVLLPDAVIAKLRGLKVWLMQRQSRALLALCLLAAATGILYAGMQRSWGDEQRSLRAATIVSSQGIDAAYEQSGWLDKKHPPLMPLLYGAILSIPQTGLLQLRLMSVLFLGGTLLVTSYLGRELYDRNTGFLAAFLFFLFPLVVRLGASAMMDTELAFFFSLALLLVVRTVRTPSIWLSLLTGLIMGLGLLTKYIMVLIYGVLLVCTIMLPSFRKRWAYLLLAILVSLCIFCIWLLYATHLGVLQGQIQKILGYSGIYYVVRALGANIPSPFQPPTVPGLAQPDVIIPDGITSLGLETLFTRLPSSLGLQFLPLILSGGLFLLRRRQTSDLFVLLWIGVVSGALFLTLPDHRYFLPAFPAVAILIARTFKRFHQYSERAVLLSFLFWAADLYLFVDWVRESHLFL